MGWLGACLSCGKGRRRPDSTGVSGRHVAGPAIAQGSVRVHKALSKVSGAHTSKPWTLGSAASPGHVAFGVHWVCRILEVFGRVNICRVHQSLHAAGCPSGLEVAARLEGPAHPAGIPCAMAGRPGGRKAPRWQQMGCDPVFIQHQSVSDAVGAGNPALGVTDTGVWSSWTDRRPAHHNGSRTTGCCGAPKGGPAVHRPTM